MREGYCRVPNPYNPKQVSRVSLKRQDVDCIVFWTRYPVGLVPYLSVLDDGGYPYYFLYTILAYPKDLEPHMPSLERRVEMAIRLARRLGADRIVWRYDPIIYTDEIGAQYHVDTFARIAGMLSGAVRRAVVSFVDMYPKVRAQTAEGGLLEPSQDIVAGTARGFASVAEKHHMTIQSCAEKRPLVDYGINPGACIDPDLVSMISGGTVSFKKDPSQRELCRCITSRDIGAYNTCLFGCEYCYATGERSRAVRNFRFHSPEADSLLPLSEEEKE